MKIRLLTAQELLKHFPLVNEDKEYLTILVHGKSVSVSKQHLGRVFDVVELVESSTSVIINIDGINITIPVWGYSFVNEDGEDVVEKKKELKVGSIVRIKTRTEFMSELRLSTKIVASGCTAIIQPCHKRGFYELNDTWFGSEGVVIDYHKELGKLFIKFEDTEGTLTFFEDDVVLLDSVTEKDEKKTGLSVNDVQYGGDHYKKMKVQVWDIVDDGEDEQAVGYYRWNAVKYLKRMGTKDVRLQEARKAMHYAQKLVEVLESMQ